MATHSGANRRRFIGAAAMTLAAAQLGIGPTLEANEIAALDRATAWLNTPRLTAAQLRGKAVLVNFCTYTCINWLRTLPYVRAWAQTYRDTLTVIGVHTPEFSFEHDLDNVRRAVQQMRIDYPVAVDNDYAIWRGFDNHYWPAVYLIDAGGRVRYRHFGEGEYQATERAIQKLAGADGRAAANGLVDVDAAGVEAPADWSNLRSPENYVGHTRTQNFASPGRVDVDRSRTYATPARLALNEWAVAGDWTIGREAIASSAPSARIVNRFHARDLHLVMGPSHRDSMIRFRVSIDGRPPGAAHGVDVDEHGNGTLGGQRLYQLIRQPAPIVDRQFEIEFVDAGAEAFSFTFG